MKKLLIFLFLTIAPLQAENIFPLDPAITYGKLDNGLTYYIRENSTPKDKVSMRLFIKSGSMMEEDHQRGLAHLLEHMAYNGSKNFPKKKIDEYLGSIGLNLGSHYNAYASYFETVYDFEIPTERQQDVETAIQILADISQNLSLEPEAFERERKIVEEEWRRKFGGDEEYFDQLKTYIYDQSRIAERDPIGTIEVIQNFKYQDAIDYYQKWYQPNRMGVFIIGDIKAAEIEPLIDKYFSGFVNSETLEEPSYKIPDFTEKKYFAYQDELVDRIDFTVWEKNSFKKLNTFENYHLVFIRSLIEDIFQRRNNEILEKNDNANFSSQLGDFQISDLDEYLITSTSLKDDEILEGIEDFLTILEQINRYGFLEDELILAKQKRIEYLQQNITKQNTRTSDSFIDEYVRHFEYDEMISGPEKELEYTSNILSEITTEDLNLYFQKYIKGDNQLITIKAPDYIKDLPSEEEIRNLQLKIAAKDIAPYEFELKKVELLDKELTGSKIIKRKRYPNTNVVKITLENGADIWLKKTDFEADEIRLKAFSFGGYSTADLDKLPSAKFTDNILASADLGNLSVTEKDNLFSQNFVDVFPTITELGEGIVGKANNENLENMFKMLYLNFTDLRIKQSHVDQFKEKEINQYNIDASNPKHQSNLDYRKKLYQNHPRTQYADAEYLKKINLKHVQEFYEDRFMDGGSFDFVIVGDFEFATIEPLIEQYIGSLPNTVRDDPHIDHGIRYTQNREYIEYKEDDPKKASVFRLYFKDFKYSYREKLKSYLLLGILDKLLFDEIREKDNLVYSISSSKYLDEKYPKEVTAYYIYYQSDPNNVETINQKIDILLEKIKNKDFDLKILDNQKLTIKNGNDSARNTNAFWLNSILNAIKFDLNIEQLTYLNTMVDSITLNEIASLAKQYFDDKYLEDVNFISE
ncbi:MAG: insulinase family protein [Proteobacteria bacterium]|nr:insulinase family protein [Pseudomonadota bacterium]